MLYFPTTAPLDLITQAASDPCPVVRQAAALVLIEHERAAVKRRLDLLLLAPSEQAGTKRQRKQRRTPAKSF